MSERAFRRRLTKAGWSDEQRSGVIRLIKQKYNGPETAYDGFWYWINALGWTHDALIEWLSRQKNKVSTTPPPPKFPPEEAISRRSLYSLIDNIAKKMVESAYFADPSEIEVIYCVKTPSRIIDFIKELRTVLDLGLIPARDFALGGDVLLVTTETYKHIARIAAYHGEGVIYPANKTW